MKRIYIVSDGTGQSAINLIKAALAQFDEKHKTVLTVNAKIDSQQKMLQLLEEARSEQVLVACTVVKKDLREFAAAYCREHSLPFLDIIGPSLDMLSQYMESAPLENPNIFRKVDDRYFRRIEAMEYTLAHDDGKNLDGLDKADIVLLGLSRTSKTPTSFVLAQHGHKVLNIPLIPQVPLSEKLFEVDQNRIVCLIMDPDVLQKVRSKRLRHYRAQSTYTNLADIFEEVEFVHELCRRNRQWHIVNTTNKSVEETAREVIHAVFGRDTEL
ncbi:kinase/pyrophosphorylase [Desulfurispirillum indicum]|uniref:Putative pyruvate, phosphate dikinase regulatory protein n=1 Tax=Desulfurispirillum indicum (strain ATCC BAA-1389 / DSM 22839 / S5) TaxID=653733 RepID=E6W6F7_DESIS|nr:pyruvate, water dikinase regulatory protein [Desulfurispirillum indicum]ADU67292.1 protein of unknown function DUF299 [Desulfurispirillum indicum S5]UCZ56664.1 kinase/pyrophosphorylase [Desulfurispirillum indicum]